MAAMASLQGDTSHAVYYSELAARARSVYIAKLWNGRYLNYDSSTSGHHDSIMSDMLAGQWYSRACALPPVVSAQLAQSCYRTIYAHNVRDFGAGSFVGAVNGMRPPPEYITSTSCSLELANRTKPGTYAPISVPVTELTTELYFESPNASSSSSSTAVVDNSCMQSREVWTGTTYALAAAMMHEAMHGMHTDAQNKPNNDMKSDQNATTEVTSSPLTSLSDTQCAELLQMSFNTARGIHDAGWQKYGYWFATPEGWERNGNYRSLGYMRALGIWAIQFAKESERGENVVGSLEQNGK